MKQFFVFVLFISCFTFGSKLPQLREFHRLIQQPKGSIFSLICNPISEDAIDLNYKFIWKKNEKPVVQSSRVSIVSEDGLSFLKIKNVSPNDSGNYSCTIKNEQGKIDTQWTVLQVKSKLVFNLLFCKYL